MTEKSAVVGRSESRRTPQDDGRTALGNLHKSLFINCIVMFLDETFPLPLPRLGTGTIVQCTTVAELQLFSKAKNFKH